MEFFGRSYNRPGPGVDRDEPRKRGIRRFFEIFVRDFGDLVKLNLLFCICCVPSVVLFIFSLSVFGGSLSLVLFVLSLAAAFPVGGAATACFFCITRRLRDDPGFVWHDFKRKFRENFVSAIPAGIFCTLVFYIQFYILIFVAVDGGAGIEAWMLAVNIVLLVLFGMIMPYVFVQIPYFYLKPVDLFRNSLILFSVNLPRSFMGAVKGGIPWALYAFFYPYSILLSPLIVVVVFSMSWLLTLMWIWKPVDGQFKIEETLRINKS
jgi:hypothetical protein